MQTLHEKNQRLYSLKKANTLKSTIISQMDEASTNRKHERMSQLAEGEQIVLDDIRRKRMEDREA